jgi:transportin-1
LHFSFNQVALGSSDSDDNERPNAGFLVCSLDLMSSVTEAIGPSIEPLIAQGNTLSLLYQSMTHDSPDARQSAFALLGDLAKFCIVLLLLFPCVFQISCSDLHCRHQGHIRPHLDKFVPLAVGNMQSAHTALCTNASWSIGELCVKVGPEIRPFAPAIIQAATQILHDSEVSEPGLMENVSITIGRLALVCPDAVGPRLDSFGPPWCYYLRHLHEDLEKMHAFHGLCLAVHANPRGILPCFRLLCEAIASWQVCIHVFTS